MGVEIVYMAEFSVVLRKLRPTFFKFLVFFEFNFTDKMQKKFPKKTKRRMKRSSNCIFLYNSLRTLASTFLSFFTWFINMSNWPKDVIFKSSPIFISF